MRRSRKTPLAVKLKRAVPSTATTQLPQAGVKECNRSQGWKWKSREQRRADPSRPHDVHPLANHPRVLRDNDLLTEKRADIEMHTGEKKSLDGFSVIDRDKFDNLIKTGEGQYPFTSSQIAAVYAHFVSLNNWQSLINMRALQAQVPGEKE